MGYVTSNLMPSESVQAWGRVHWSIFVPGVFWLGVAAIPGVWALRNQNDASLSALVWMAGLAAGLMLIRALWKLFWAWILVISTEVAVTNRRVMVKWGFIRRQTVELLHSKVESIQVHQSILGRILGFGSLAVNGIGVSSAPVPFISAPLRFRKQALQIIDQS